jgi:hypothetical protein
VSLISRALRSKLVMSNIDENGFLDGRIGSWIAAHTDRHAALFTAIHELNQECHRFLDGRAVDVSSDLQITTAVLFARLLELFQGLFITVGHGMMSVGRILGRAHLEAFFYLMAIHRDPTFLGQYLDQLQYHRRALVNRIRNSNDPHLASLREALDETLAQEISDTITEQNIRPLTIEDAARRANLYAVYATAYAILSGAVHASGWDLESHLDYDHEEQTIRSFVYGPSDSWTEKILRGAGMNMAEALETISSILGEDRAQLCGRFKSQFMDTPGES